MKGFVLGAHVIALSLVAQVGFAQTVASPTPAAPPTPSASATPPAPQSTSSDDGTTTTIRIPKMDHHIEVALRGGLQLPGEVTPKGLLVGKTGVAPAIFGEAALVVHPFFTLGLFSQFSSADYKQYIGDAPQSDGTLNTLTGGASLKARLPVSEALVLRAGFLIGANLEFASGNVNGGGGSYGAHGYGFDIAPTVEAAYRVSHAIGLSGQFAFVSQPAGSVSFDGDSKSHDFGFAPLYLLALGVEFDQ